MCWYLVPTVPQGHEDRVTTLGKFRGPPRRPRRTLEETPGESPENPLRGKLPQSASRRVVPLGWWPSGTFRSVPIKEKNRPALSGVWIGGVWNGHFPDSEKYFSEAEFPRKIPEILQKAILAKFQAPKFKYSPCPSFPCFFQKGKENHQKNKDFLSPPNP